jgi:exodeoxyribonuclease VII large subunit
VLIYPVTVQGTSAAAEICAAIAAAGARAECDVLILARGGGSLEDLWAFNQESLARAMVASPIPIITGIGHEIDFTIADLAADRRAPTPSAAAEIVVPDCEEWLVSLHRSGQRLQRALLRSMRSRSERLRWLIGRAAQVSPVARLAQQSQRLDELEQRLNRAMRRLLSERRAALSERRGALWQASPIARLQGAAARHAFLVTRLRAAALETLRRAGERLAPLARTLNAVSPLATLQRGYAIVVGADGRILRDAAEAAPGSILEARLAQGTLRARVEKSS